MSGGQLAPIIQQLWKCSEPVARAIAQHGHLVHFANRAKLYAGTADSRHVGLIVDGHARALAFSFDGRQILVEDFHSGDLYGDVLAFSGASADAAEVVAHGPVQAGKFTTGYFVALMEQHHCIALVVARALHKRLAQANRKVVQIASVSAPGRVHGELFRLGKEGGWRIEPAPIISELALSVQTTRETASRAISQLEKRGITKREGRALLIIAPHRLEELVY